MNGLMSIPPIWAYAPNCVQREYVVGFNMNSKYVYVDIYIYIIHTRIFMWYMGSSWNQKCPWKKVLRNNHSQTDPSVLECWRCCFPSTCTTRCFTSNNNHYFTRYDGRRDSSFLGFSWVFTCSLGARRFGPCVLSHHACVSLYTPWRFKVIIGW